MGRVELGEWPFGGAVVGNGEGCHAGAAAREVTKDLCRSVVFMPCRK